MSLDTIESQSPTNLYLRSFTVDVIEPFTWFFIKNKKV